MEQPRVVHDSALARRGGSQRIVKPIIACLLGAGLMIGLATERPFGPLPVFVAAPLTTILDSTFSFGGELVGQEFHHGGVGWSVKIGQTNLMVVQSYLVDALHVIPLLATIVIATSIAFARAHKLGSIAAVILSLVSCALVAFGLPAASGFLRGVVVGLASSEQYVSLTERIARDTAPMLVCTFIAFSWWVACRIFVDDAPLPRESVDATRRPLHLWIATGAAATLVTLWACSSIAVMKSGYYENDNLNFWRAARFVGLAIPTGLAAGLLIFALVRAKPAKWAWLVLLLLLPLGAESMGGVLLLLTALSDSDFPTTSADPVPL